MLNLQHSKKKIVRSLLLCVSFDAPHVTALQFDHSFLERSAASQAALLSRKEWSETVTDVLADKTTANKVEGEEATVALTAPEDLPQTTVRKPELSRSGSNLSKEERFQIGFCLLSVVFFVLFFIPLEFIYEAFPGEKLTRTETRMLRGLWNGTGLPALFCYPFRFSHVGGLFVQRRRREYAVRRMLFCVFYFWLGACWGLSFAVQRGKA